MICNSCGTNNPVGVTNCINCGAPLGQNPNGFSGQQGYPGGQGGFVQRGPVMGIEKRNIVTAVILTFVTCGIYGLIWFMHLTDDSNKLSDDVNPTSGGKALLFSIITCGIYSLYWTYKRGEIIDKYHESTGKSSSNNILYLILTLVGCGIIAWILLQNELNKAADGI